MDSAAFLEHLTTETDYQGQIVHVEHIPPRGAVYAQPDEPLAAAVEACLRQHRMWPLYLHQALAVDHLKRGEQVMVATASASGKSLCYHVPVLESVVTDRQSTALYLFPTKALAQDQRRGLEALFCPALLKPGDFATFDGDTPGEERAVVRQKARIVLTNPDMLHVGILPNHQSWSRLLANLKYVVVDEAHTYRGVFGSHVAGVLRRLRRLCRQYGAAPQFIACSATIANPGEHAARLVGLPFTVVAEDGSPRGGRDFVFWNPPLIDAAKSRRGSPNSEATHLFTELVHGHIRTLTFARTRRLTELIYRYARDRLEGMAPELAARIKPYRAGYLAADRRRIERGLFGGELLGVVATTALELGVDIGSLEATVLTGYPGSIASTWQQAGRSGRGKGSALSFLIGLDNPLDQYLMRHPEYFFGQEAENALVNPDNPYILRAHLLSAAWEWPLDQRDQALFGPAFAGQVAELEQRGLLRQRRGRWYLPAAVACPAASVSLRAASGENVALVDSASGALLETLEMNLAMFQAHPGAVYLHQGEPYLVTGLDLAGRTAYAQPTRVPYYTQTRDLTDLRVVRVRQQKLCRQTRVYLGEVAVTTTILGYKKKMPYTEEIIGEENLDLPPQHFNTVALWFDLPPRVTAPIGRAGLDLAGGLHAAEHAAISLLPLFALCDRNDIGGVSTALHPDTGGPEIFIYDAYPGGVGIAEKGFALVEELWQATLRAITECPCREGCPGCIQSPKCGNNNQPLDKKAARMLLSGLLGGYQGDTNEKAK